MKYCMDYNKQSKLLDKVDEININIRNLDDLQLVIDWTQSHNKQRINLCLLDYELGLNEGYIKKALQFQKEQKDNLDIAIRLPGRSEELDVMLLDYPEAKIYFDEKITSWDRLIGTIEYGVSDVFICEGLGFELDKIAAIAHPKNIQIRVYPNVAQTSWKQMPSLKTFFIRPEDVKEYEKYVDIFEFYGEEEKFDILYDIYKKDKIWFGKLNELIVGFNDDIDSRYIIPRFAKKRIKCNRECLKGGNCHICDHIKDLSLNLEKAGLIVTFDKENEEEDK